MPSLEGKSAVVTGASSGIGAATAVALAAEGARVVGGARRFDRIAPPVTPLELDVTDPESCERFVQAASETLSGIDILVNAAGLALGRDPFDDSTEEDERLVLDTNVNGLIRMTRLCLPHIRDNGHIVNIGSVAGRQAYAKGSLYVTSKFAVRGFTYALREDLLGRPIPASCRRTSRSSASGATKRPLAGSTRASRRCSRRTSPSASSSSSAGPRT
jgi:3-hydroxy acid dehydrogenase / malonic semialdehyde reductase